MSAQKPILLIVPTFNEEKNLPFVLRALHAARSDCDALVVDDGSSDGSAAVAREHGAMVFSHPKNRGYGAALVTGYRHALAHGYETVVQADADGQHDPAQIEILLEAMRRTHADMVVGSRMGPGGGYRSSPARFVGIHLFAMLGRALTGRVITDPTSGFAAMNRAAISFLVENTPDDYPDLNVLIALHRAGVRVEEVPVRMAPRLSGESQLTSAKAFLYVPKMLRYIWEVYRAPKSRTGGATV